MHQMFCSFVRLAGRRRGLVLLWLKGQKNGSAGSVAVSKARLAGQRTGEWSLAARCGWLGNVLVGDGYGSVRSAGLRIRLN